MTIIQVRPLFRNPLIYTYIHLCVCSVNYTDTMTKYLVYYWQLTTANLTITAEPREYTTDYSTVHSTLITGTDNCPQLDW